MKKDKALVPVEKKAQSHPRTGTLSIYEYERKYARRQNTRGARGMLRLVAIVVGLALFALLFFVALEVYRVNEYAGYVAGGVFLLLFILLYIVPVARVMHAPRFETNVNAYTARAAKRHNKKVRREVAEKIVELTASVDGVGWYDSETVVELAACLKSGDDDGIKRNLTLLYGGSVKKSAKELIFRSSMRSATYSALSQTAKIDSLLVVFVNLQLVRDLVFLYGFRPSDARLFRIFCSVLQNSLIAYGVGGVNLGGTVVKTMGDAVKGIPFLGTAISAIVDSSVQGLVNGTLTTVIGYQTIRYLATEYRLQNILDGVDVSETPEELQEACSDLEAQLKNKKKFAKAV